MSVAAIRPPAVAGQYYTGEAARLRSEVEAMLGDVVNTGAVPKALIVPHAGHVYSGPIAASAYRLLGPGRGRIRRVVLAGPAHRVPVQGIAVPSAQAFATPLGTVPLDRAALDALRQAGLADTHDLAHAHEHSLEVQLPFLQVLLDDWQLVPLVVGAAAPATVAAAFDTLWGGDETLILVSTDLSHFHDDATARQLDARTSAAIVALDPDPIGGEDACGCHPLRGLLVAARRHGLAARCLDLRNSSDTAGTRDRVVGYGAYALE